MRIYTGGGDRGKTSLFSGERVSKDDQRVEAYGDVDELNSVLGILAAYLHELQGELAQEIEQIQSDLLHVGAWLATTPASPSVQVLQEIAGRHQALEAAIDRMDQELPALTGFVLPGGHLTAGWAHVARTVCRRAERHVVRLLDGADEGKAATQLREAVVYLNRLSDYLFVLARYCNRLVGTPDALWQP